MNATSHWKPHAPGLITVQYGTVRQLSERQMKSQGNEKYCTVTFEQRQVHDKCSERTTSEWQVNQRPLQCQTKWTAVREGVVTNQVNDKSLKAKRYSSKYSNYTTTSERTTGERTSGWKQGQKHTTTRERQVKWTNDKWTTRPLQWEPEL